MYVKKRKIVGAETFMETLEIFNYPPTVEILERLIEGSLKQDLPKSIRLWVILRTLYGEAIDDPVKMELGNKFTFLEWQEQFFSDKKAHFRDTRPPKHDPKCNCAKTIKQWLFDPLFENPESVWKAEFKKHYPLKNAELNSLLSSGKLPLKNGQPHKYSLPGGRLFAVTGKNLQTEFNALVKMGYLKKNSETYFKVKKLPQLPINNQSNLDRLILEASTPINVSNLFDKFGQNINGEPRFFLEIEDIIPAKLSDKVEDLQNQLERLWQQKPVPPILLKYCSAKLYQEEVECVVYPVCLYYFRRAPYLIAYGESPGNPTKINWYDYRLDHIIYLKELNWEDVDIRELRQKCLVKNPPNLARVRDLMTEALGFEFYQPSAKMLVRFDRYFHNNYIKKTERDSIFQRTSPSKSKNVVSKDKSLTQIQRQQLLSRIDAKKMDIYCQVKYRENDNNIIMRIRAWGPNVEVILPYSLRQKMAEDIAKNWENYR